MPKKLQDITISNSLLLVLIIVHVMAMVIVIHCHSFGLKESQNSLIKFERWQMHRGGPLGLKTFCSRILNSLFYFKEGIRQQQKFV